MLIGMVIRSWFVYFVNAFLVSKHIGYKLWEQFKNLFPILALSILAFLTSYLVGKAFHFNMYLVAIIEGLVFISVYLGTSLAFRLEAMYGIKQMAKGYMMKKKK